MARTTRQDKKNAENVCSYCLFFQRDPSGHHSMKGNCTYHKEWIENASLTTCSDMSNRALKEKGIYRLIRDNDEGWIYVQRREKLRTRLFLVKSTSLSQLSKVKRTKV